MDPAIGKLRTDCQRVSNHRDGEWRKRQTEKRGKGGEQVPLDGNEPVDGDTAERIYEREWARGLW